MQGEKQRRSQAQRTETTRGALVAAGRQMFMQKGFAVTGTPEIVAGAGVTRGALYHHFADKADLFRAVIESEAASVAAEIDAASHSGGDPLQALARGSEAFMRAMAVEGRTRLLLVEGPAVLGRAELDRIDRTHSGRTLREGLGEAMRSGAIRQLPLDALAAQLSALFDRAALEVAGGGDAADHLTIIQAVLEGLRPKR